MPASPLTTLRQAMAMRKLAEDVRRRREQAMTLAHACDPSLPSVELVAALSSHLEPPYHLQPYADVLDTAIGTGQRVVVAAPPQHGKTELTKAGLLRMMMLGGRRSYAYATYNQDRSDEVARSAKDLAENAGWLSPGGSVRKWWTRNRSQVRFTSVGGSLTGYPIDGCLIVDDPHKDRPEAESPRYRERAWNWLTDVGKTRCHPGVSIIVMATRWHEDDLSGRCIADGWRYINLEAICETLPDPVGRQLGNALWPAHRPLDFLEQFRGNAYSWASLYMGRPRPRGGAVFGEPTWYDELPDLPGYREAVGLDMAYTASSRADFSVALKGRRYKDRLYITHGVRRQCEATVFTAAVNSLVVGPQRCPVWWYLSGTEKGLAQTMQLQIPGITAKPAVADKFVRALPVSGTWNNGRVLLPSRQSPNWGPWVDDMVRCVCGFTGVSDPHDDDVDALAALHDALMTGSAKASKQDLSNIFDS